MAMLLIRAIKMARIAPPPPGSQGKLCYSSESCYTLYPLDDVNTAENMYQYVGPGDSGFPSGLNPNYYRKPQNLFFVPQVPGETQISPNFRRQEVIWANSTRGHYGHFSRLVVEKLQALRERFGRPLVINSGYRSPGYNATLNGAARFSRHTYGDAVDFKIAGVGFGEIANACKQLGAAFTQIYRSHIHCDWRTSPLDEKVFGPSASGQLNSLSAEDVHSAMHAESRINTEVVDFQNANEIQVRFQADTPSEDGGELMHQWNFIKNGQLVASSNKSEPVLTLDPGSYLVRVKVEGSVEIEELFDLD